MRFAGGQLYAWQRTDMFAAMPSVIPVADRPRAQADAERRFKVPKASRAKRTPSPVPAEILQFRALQRDKMS